MDGPLFAALHLPIDAAALFLRKINASYINFSGWFHWFSLISLRETSLWSSFPILDIIDADLQGPQYSFSEQLSTGSSYL